MKTAKYLRLLLIVGFTLVTVSTWGAETPGTEKWSFMGFYDFKSSPVIGADGTIYALDTNSNLYALKPNGLGKWVAPFNLGGPGAEGAQSSPAIGRDGTIYAVGGDGEVWAIVDRGGLSPGAGTRILNRIGGSFTASPALAPNGNVILATTGGFLTALRPDGKQAWGFGPSGSGGGSFSSPALNSDGTIYYAEKDNTGLYAVDSTSGKSKWKSVSLINKTSSPAIGPDGTIYIGGAGNTLTAINPDGSEKWAFPTGAKVTSSPAVGVDGIIYVGSGDGKLYAIRPNGTLKWATSLAQWGGIKSSPVIGPTGIIYIGADDECVYAVNPDGNQRWRYAIGGISITSSPALGPDGTIYVGTNMRRVYAIYGDTPSGGSEGLAQSPWPMFHRDVRHRGSLQSGAPLSAYLILLLGN